MQFKITITLLLKENTLMQLVSILVPAILVLYLRMIIKHAWLSIFDSTEFQQYDIIIDTRHQ